MDLLAVVRFVFCCVPGRPSAELLCGGGSGGRGVEKDGQFPVSPNLGENLEKIGYFWAADHPSFGKYFKKSERIFKKPLCNDEKMGYNREDYPQNFTR